MDPTAANNWLTPYDAGYYDNEPPVEVNLNFMQVLYLDGYFSDIFVYKYSMNQAMK